MVAIARDCVVKSPGRGPERHPPSRRDHVTSNLVAVGGTELRCSPTTRSDPGSMAVGRVRRPRRSGIRSPGHRAPLTCHPTRAPTVGLQASASGRPERTDRHAGGLPGFRTGPHRRFRGRAQPRKRRGLVPVAWSPKKSGRVSCTRSSGPGTPRAMPVLPGAPSTWGHPGGPRHHASPHFGPTVSRLPVGGWPGRPMSSEKGGDGAGIRFRWRRYGPGRRRPARRPRSEAMSWPRLLCGDGGTLRRRSERATPPR